MVIGKYLPGSWQVRDPQFARSTKCHREGIALRTRNRDTSFTLTVPEPRVANARGPRRVMVFMSASFAVFSIHVAFAFLSCHVTVIITHFLVIACPQRTSYTGLIPARPVRIRTVRERRERRRVARRVNGVAFRLVHGGLFQFRKKQTPPLRRPCDPFQGIRHAKGRFLGHYCGANVLINGRISLAGRVHGSRVHRALGRVASRVFGFIISSRIRVVVRHNKRRSRKEPEQAALAGHRERVPAPRRAAHDTRRARRRARAAL